MKPIMIVEFWERLRGYDKWIETEATVESAKLIDGLRRTRPAWWRLLLNPDILISFFSWHAQCAMAWTDVSGGRHTTDYEVSEQDPLFQKFEGQKVLIRYNPTRPDDYYVQEGATTRARFALVNWIFRLYAWTVCAVLALNLLRMLGHFNRH
jgi:hypothetical protein